MGLVVTESLDFCQPVTHSSLLADFMEKVGQVLHWLESRILAIVFVGFKEFSLFHVTTCDVDVRGKLTKSLRVYSQKHLGCLRWTRCTHFLCQSGVFPAVDGRLTGSAVEESMMYGRALIEHPVPDVGSATETTKVSDRGETAGETFLR